MVGKHDETGARLISWTGELSPRALAGVLARRLDPMLPGFLKSRARVRPLLSPDGGANDQRRLVRRAHPIFA